MRTLQIYKYETEEALENAIKRLSLRYVKDPAYVKNRVTFSVYKASRSPNHYVFSTNTEKLDEETIDALSLVPYRENIMPFYPLIPV